MGRRKKPKHFQGLLTLQKQHDEIVDEERRLKKFKSYLTEQLEALKKEEKQLEKMLNGQEEDRKENFEIEEQLLDDLESINSRPLILSSKKTTNEECDSSDEDELAIDL